MDSGDWLLVVGVVAVGGLAIVTAVMPSASEKEAKRKAELQKADSIAYVHKLDSIQRILSSGIDTTSRNYILSQSELEKMTDSAMTASRLEKPLYYNGVHVRPLMTSSNAKLIGVDNFDINLGDAEYSAKGLLFEIGPDTTLNLIAPSDAYYIGQRYDIEYHTFKDNVPVMGKDLLRMFFGEGKERGVYSDWDRAYNSRYDGIIVSSDLMRRDR